MNLSKKSRYGIRALIDMTVNFKEDLVALSSIAEKNDISIQYLEQIFAGLRRAGIIRGVKGSKGGYVLDRNPADITLSQIIEALDGDYRIESEEFLPNLSYAGILKVIQREVIDKMNKSMENLLENITLEQLAEEYKKDSLYGVDMYYI
ncbi:MAG TPA: Rrf2 family transcriptional regulator [Lachnospiraceae bacterium]